MKQINEEEFANKLKLKKKKLSGSSAKESNNNINVNVFSNQESIVNNQKNSLLNKLYNTPQEKDLKKSIGVYSYSSKGVIDININPSNNNVNKLSSGRAFASSVNKNIVKRRTHISDKSLINPVVTGASLNIVSKKKK